MSEPVALAELYRLMFRIRTFEQAVAEAFMEGLVPGTIHLSTGQEACAVGVISCLRRPDRVMLTHRPHGHALAKGMEPAALMAEILGRRAGCTGGVGGSMHLVDVSDGIMPSMPIVGAGIPIAAGVAFGLKAKGCDDVCVSFFGDGATNIGAFHEALNLAAIWSLPILFVCENNLYAVSTRITSTTRASTLAERALPYGIPATTVDGNDVTAVREAALQGVTRARSGDGPSFLECLTYRHGGHSRSDPATYRPPEELACWKLRDPISRCRTRLIESGECSETAVARIEEQELALVRDAARAARASEEPDPAGATRHVLVEEVGQ